VNHAPLRTLPRTRLQNLVPALVQDRSLVALVPRTTEVRWATEAAWDFARAAAQGRRVALVDLHLEQPRLHEVRGARGGEGITDAFARDLELTDVTQDLGRGLFFIPAGSHTEAASEVIASPRWRRLHAGFRSEGALLILFVPPNTLPQLAVVPDGVVMLAPDGAAESTAMDDETSLPLLGVIRERWTPPSLPQVLEPAQVPERRRSRSLIAAVVIATVGAGGWALFASSAERPSAGSLAAPAPAGAPDATPRDTFPWTVQLAAYGTLEGAMSHTAALEHESVPVLIAPVVPSGGAAVWYRVLAGSYATRDSAIAARAALWSTGAAAEGQGDLLRAPFSLRLESTVDADALRTLGVPATRWHDGQLLLGAFETPEQAGFAEALAARAGASATVITRMGDLPR
jgi:cell division septation protein DedD